MSKIRTLVRLLKTDRDSIPVIIMHKLSSLCLLNWMTDKQLIKIRYRAVFHKKPDLDNPRTFNEKLQWMKLYDRRPEYTMMSDKYMVREFIQQKLGEEYLIPLLGKWDRVKDIDFDSLPDQFVLKCNHDSGSVIVCRDRKHFDQKETVKKLKKAMRRNMFWYCREWPYKNIKPCIIAEKLMADERQTKTLIDYKFYCFNGDPKFLYISKDLYDHAIARISFLNTDWSFAPFRRTDYLPMEELPEKPVKYDEMLQIAKKLSAGMPFVRVDLYEIAGKVYFSELTFSPGSGLSPFDPGCYDEIIGQWLDLDDGKM